MISDVIVVDIVYTSDSQKAIPLSFSKTWRNGRGRYGSFVYKIFMMKLESVWSRAGVTLIPENDIKDIVRLLVFLYLPIKEF